jgi:uncharacterized membrane protein YfcA
MNEILPINWYWIMGIGFLGGTLGSLLGVGGGILVVPALVIALGVEQKVAQGTSLAMMVPMALMATMRYHYNPNIELKWGVIVILAVCAVIGANVGSSIVDYMPPKVLKRIFGIFVIASGAKMIWSTFK